MLSIQFWRIRTSKLDVIQNVILFQTSWCIILVCYTVSNLAPPSHCTLGGALCSWWLRLASDFIHILSWADNTAPATISARTRTNPLRPTWKHPRRADFLHTTEHTAAKRPVYPTKCTVGIWRRASSPAVCAFIICNTAKHLMTTSRGRKLKIMTEVTRYELVTNFLFLLFQRNAAVAYPCHFWSLLEYSATN